MGTLDALMGMMEMRWPALCAQCNTEVEKKESGSVPVRRGTCPLLFEHVVKYKQRKNSFELLEERHSKKEQLKREESHSPPNSTLEVKERKPNTLFLMDQPRLNIDISSSERSKSSDKTDYSFSEEDIDLQIQSPKAKNECDEGDGQYDFSAAH